tara:strand:+ start:343 stop:537 length:195 start_codon:yes stop_codon:yes gene_type:complete
VQSSDPVTKTLETVIDPTRTQLDIFGSDVNVDEEEEAEEPTLLLVDDVNTSDIALCSMHVTVPW